MADFDLKNDLVYTFTIRVEDAAGDMVPAPTGDTFSVTCSDTASLGVAIGADSSGNPAVVCTPLVPTATAITVTTSDSAGLKVSSNVFDIAADTAPTQIVLDTADAQTAPQAVPTAPAAPAAPTTP